ncbi:MAG: FHA domain-containing protein [Acidobacteriota bacterium]|nr:FHA domain-containing protein [Acidobacteriota bacterium]
MANKYIIIREDLVQDPLTVISDGLLVGRLLECELLLNHPAVSRTQAGIKEVNGNYYLFSLRPPNPVVLNGKPVEGNEALAPGDILEVGPFLLEIDRTDEALVIKVSLRIGVVAEVGNFSSPDLGTTKLVMPTPGEGKRPKAPRPAPLPGDKALDIFWDKRIREAGKMVRPSPLFPKSQKRSGKTQFNWTPTTDLGSRWPASFFVWGAIVVGLLSVAAAYAYTSAYAPAPISQAHTKSRLDVVPAIAAKPNGSACTSCHSFTGSMEANCSQCHTAAGFVATVIEPHAAAGVGCVSCHSEHRGANFKAAEAALATCTECHNDANRNTYNGRKVGTPHGGIFGYPVVAGKWTWKGLNDNEWSLKKIAIARLPADTDEKWRSKEFHALHVQRVRALKGMPANAQGELSCSSCHKSFNPIDRETPRTTCAGCHNGSVEPGSSRVLIAQDKPNCVSCHVQHLKDRWRWNSSMLAAK